MTSAFKLFRPFQLFCTLLLWLLSSQAWSQCGPLPSATLTANQWSLASLPCLPNVPTVEGIWGDELGAGSYDVSWVVYERNEATDSYTKLAINSPVNQDSAYWILSLSGASWNLDGTPTPVVGSIGCPAASCYEIPLTPPANPGEMRYNMVGFPFATMIPWQDVHVRTSSLGVLNPSEAQALNVMSNTFWIWNGNAYEVANDVTPGMMGELQSYRGMFVEALGGAIGQNPVLLIPTTAVNDPPDATADSLTVLEGGSQTVLDSTQTSVLDNDNDREGQTLVVTAVPPAAPPVMPINGTVILNNPGTFQYDHDGSETTSDAFEYEVCENTAPFQCSNGAVNVTVTPVNDAPMLGAIGDQTIDELVNLNFAATSTDAEGDARIFSLTGVVPTGATISPAGVFNFTPTEAQGPDSFTFNVVVTDNGTPNMSDSETITVTVNEVNVAPTFNDQTLGPVNETAADMSAVGTVAVTDPDVPANTLNFSITGGNSGSAFDIDNNGQITVNDTDAIDFDDPPLAGPPRFELTVEVDDGVAQPTATVTIPISDIAPDIANETFTVAEDIADSSVLGAVPNSGDINGLAFSFTGGSNVGGAFAIDSDGQITVNDTNAIDFENPPLAGPERFELAVMVTDGTTADTATVTVNITNVDEPPVLNLDDSNNGGNEPNFAATFNTSIGNPISIVDTSLSVTDPDAGAMISSATVTITNVQDAPNELLSVAVSGAILPGDVSFNATTGALTINRVTTLADYQDVLRTLTYDNNAAVPTLNPARVINAVVNDGINNSATVTSTVTLISGPTLDLDDDNSTATGNNFSGAFTEGSATAAADADVTVTSPTINLASATATLTSRPDGDANEVLAATASGGIGAGDISYTAATGVLTIAPAVPQLVADFEAVLESLTYNNTSDTPTETDRTINVVVTDTNTSNSEVAVSTISVTAVNDAPTVADKNYNATGNVQISVPDGASDLLNGATDPEGDTPITINSFQSTSANGGAVTADTNTGSFTYDPPPGFTGNDTFTYTLTDDGGTTVSGNITVTVTVSDLIWFIDDNPAQTGNDGTLTNPFTTLAAFDTANGSGGNNPAAGQCIFLHTGNYTGGVTLLNNQRFLGQGGSATIQTFCGVTPATNSISLPGVNGTDPVITHTGAATNDGVSLAQGNTVRGLNIGNTGGFGIDGSNVGVLNISEVAVTGSGGGVRITGGGTLNAVFDSISSTNSPAEGILLDSVMGSFSVTGTTGVTLPAAEAIEVVNVPSGQTLNFTLTGNTTVNSGTSSGIRLDNTLGTLNGTIAGAGSSVQTTSGQVLHIRNVNLGASGMNFASLTATGTGTEHRIDLENVNNNTFNGGTVSLAGTSAPGTDGIQITGTSSSIFNFGSTTIDDMQNRGIFLSSGNGPVTFTSVDIDGTGGAGIAISGNTSAVNVNGGSIGSSDDPGGNGVSVTGGSGNVTIAASITKTTATEMISVTTRIGGTVTLSGNLNATGGTSNGISVQNNTGGATTFSGTSKVLSTGNNVGVNLATNPGHSISFTGGGLDIDTASGIGFSATGGGTVNVTGAGNTVNTSTGRIINMSGVAVGGSNMTFNSLASSGNVPTDAIAFNNVDANTFNGGSVNIADTSGAGSDGISISGGSNSTFSFASATIDNTQAHGINLNGSNGPVTFTTVNIDGTTGAGIQITSNTGTVNVNGGTIGGSNDPAGIGVDVNDGSANITIAAAITKTTAGNIVEVTGRTGGLVTFSGNLSATGGVANGIDVNNNTAGATTFSGGAKTINTGANTGVSLLANGGHTINFNGGGLDIDTTTAIGFNATGGGVVTAQGAGNSINSVSATALNINATTIGASDLTFASIASGNNNANPDPASGIVLNNTGISGGLTVTGDGVNTTQGGNASGGLIQNTTGTAIAINGSHELNLARMRVLTPGGNGILADQLTGQGSIRHTTIEDVDASNTSGLFIRNDNVNLNAGTGFTVDNSIFRNAATGQVMFLVEGRGTSVMNITVEDSLFTDLVPDAYQHSAGLDPGDSGTITTIFQNNTVRDARAGVGSSVINFGKAHSANSNFTISGNTIQNVGIPGVNGGVINIAASAANLGGTITGTISGNRLENIDGRRRGINVVPEPASGSVGTVDVTVTNNDINDMTNGIGIFVDIRENTPLTHLRVTNNRVGTGNFGTTPGNVGGTRDGVFIQADDTQPKTMNVLFTNNTIHVTNMGTGVSSDQAAVIKADNDNVTVNATVHSNTIIQGAGGTGDFVFESEGASTYCLDLNAANVGANANSAVTGIVLEREAAATFHIEGMVAGPHSNATVEAFLDPRNNNHVLSPVGNGFTNNGGAGCPMPPP